ncbi:MAG: HYR domain-containing protein [Acidobacteria bacterium]|nr:HYR domain-containing protein [Acidobacteriota bacterium]
MRATNRILDEVSGRFVAVLSAIAVLSVAPVLAQHHDTAARAGSQSLTVARHVDTTFTLATAQTAMANATTVIRACDGTPNADEDVACQVTMQVSGGSIGTFGATGDGGDVISSDAEMTALINSGTADVMVVTAIMFCSGPAGPGLTIIGCGNVGAQGIVSVNSLAGNLLGVEITHEFLHNQGHNHRGDAGEAAQTPGAILNPVLNLSSNIINEAECGSLHAGAADNGPIVDPPPIITCPADSTAECTSPAGAQKTDAAIASFLSAVSATDGCEPTPVLTNNAPAVFPKGTISVTFTATDADFLGATSMCSANLRVVDTKAPSITCPAGITVECSQHGGTPATNPAIAAFLGGASATDTCDPSPVISNSAPAVFPLGTTSVTFSARDADGNVGTCTASVRIVDTTPPVITCPAAVTVECSQHGGTPASDPVIAAFLNGASATDTCDPSPAITNNAPTLFPLGTTSVAFTATDASGNATSCSANVRVVDTTPPTVVASLGRTVLWPPNHRLADVRLGASVTDICDPNPAIDVFVFGDEDDVEPTGGGRFSPDARSIALGTLLLRQERKGDSDGRVYLPVVTGTDMSGNVGFDCDTVVIPHDLSAASIADVDAQAGAGRAFCLGHHGAAPPGYFVIGDGPAVGPQH